MMNVMDMVHSNTRMEISIKEIFKMALGPVLERLFSTIRQATTMENGMRVPTMDVDA